ncbi:uncharacterized protein [Temnothorax longispinosus]
MKKEIVDDDDHLPLSANGRVVSYLQSAKGSNVSDGASRCTDPMTHSDDSDNVDHAASPITKKEALKILIEALEAEPKKKLQISKIYDYAEENYPRFIRKIKWKDRLRRELSDKDNKHLFKLGRRGPGRGRYWILQERPDERRRMRERTPTMEETVIIYYVDKEKTPYRIKLKKPPGSVTLADFKVYLN